MSNRSFKGLSALLLVCFGSFLLAEKAAASPAANGKTRFLGCVHSASQSTDFTAYWNQVTPENAGKWGSVESKRDVMKWSALDDAYQLAKSNGFPFRFHVLVWGNQQPSWIESLPVAEQRAEIEEWFDAVSARYPDIDYLEVVNEPLHDPPNQSGNGGGNYINALGGSGSTGWDWVLEAFRMARSRFPNSQLVLNDYSIINSTANRNAYLGIINLLKAEGLIDVIGVQGHAFSTTASASTMLNNLNALAATGLPIQVTEMDVDGPDDATQLANYQRIFPVFWQHPAVVGVTLWGFRPGLWRDAQKAYLVNADGSERPALIWLKGYVAGTEPRMGFAGWCAAHGLCFNQRDPTADLDADLLPAGLEYLTGRDPSMPEPGSPLLWMLGSGNFQLTLPVSPLVSEGLLEIESSAGLSDWTSEASYDGSTSTANGLVVGGTVENPFLSFSRPVLPGESQRFFRVSFQLP